MLNQVLAVIAAMLWSTAYSWYFMPDLRRWLWQRRHRRELAEMQRARAHAAWMQREQQRTKPRPERAPRA